VAWIEAHFYSVILGQSCTMNVLLPEEDQGIGVDASVWDGKTELPVLYLLHGMGDDHSIWMRRTSIERYAAGRRLAIVMPAAAKSNYVDQVYGENYFRFLTKELPGIVSRFFRVSTAREKSFIAGLSMGGYGAMRAALGCPERYCAVASMSGGLDLTKHGFQYFEALSQQGGADKEQVPQRVRTRIKSWRLAFGDADTFLGSDNNLMRLLERQAKSGTALPKIHISIGRQDALYESNRSFCEKLDGLGIPYEYLEEDGGHEWGMWDRFVQTVLDWLPIEI